MKWLLDMLHRGKLDDVHFMLLVLRVDQLRLCSERKCLIKGLNRPFEKVRFRGDRKQEEMHATNY